MDSYDEPLALVIVSSISIGIAAIFAGWIALDIFIRRGWRSMMLVMIPVYVINALYLWPITLWTYINYGRPSKPGTAQQPETDHRSSDDNGQIIHHHDSGAIEQPDHQQLGNKDGRYPHDYSRREQNHEDMEGKHHNSDRPMFATVTIGVCHCGAGCVLGDIVGEWLVYGTNASIGSPPRLLWTEFLVDFAFAFAFGIVFQYFSIAPMAGEYGPRILVRALKADALSLLFFEIGLFGWMAAFQIGIFQWRLEITTVSYWWMMQIGMFIGHWTGIPINWWLIKNRIKEPCA